MVATDDSNTPITLDDLPDRCATACEQLAACDVSGSCESNGDVVECVTAPTQEECEQGCVDDLGAAIATGDARCQALVSDMLDCAEQVACSDLNIDSCAAESDALKACSGGDSSGPDQKDNPGTGMLIGDPPMVTCQAGSGRTFVPEVPDPNDPPGVVCDVQWAMCSDGHDYRLSCVDHQGTGSVVCSCIVDGHVTGGFDGGNLCLEDDATMTTNGECGWSLSF
jgi:hypothetical protein